MKQSACLWCGNPLPKYRRKYCSDECSEKYYLHYIAPFDWANAKQMALERAGNRCEVCGSKGYLEVHHKERLNCEPRHNNPKNRLSNLIVLCCACHHRAHSKNYSL